MIGGFSKGGLGLLGGGLGVSSSAGVLGGGLLGSSSSGGGAGGSTGGGGMDWSGGARGLFEEMAAKHAGEMYES